MVILTIEHQIQLIQFPNKKVCEIVVENDDGSFTIFIDSSITKERQIKAYMHALKHIHNNDFEKYYAQQIESESHKN